MNYLYPELSPKPRFFNILTSHILPELEKDGFKLLKSGPSLKRVENGFEWLVEFDGRKYNVDNFICRFNPYFSVRNSHYRKYLKNHPVIKGTHGHLGNIGTTSGIRHWDKQLFSLGDSEAYFLEDNDFAKHDNLQLVEEMIQNIRTVGVPYFEMMSDFDGIRHFYGQTKQLVYAPMMVDMCYVLKREEELPSLFDWYYSLNENCAEWVNQEMAVRKDFWQQQNL